MESLIVTENDSGQRLNKFLAKVFPNLPKSMMYKSIRKKNIKVNGRRCDAKDILLAGDVVDIYLNDKFLSKQTDKNKFVLFDKDLNIVYEDDNIIIVNKPVGLKSQPDYSSEDNLIDRINGYLVKNGKFDYKLEKSFRPALCNRLDRNTDGLVIAAKNFKTLQEINRLIRERKIVKIYCCLVEGNLQNDHDVLVGWWSKNKKNNKVSISSEKRSDSKKVITEYFVLQRFKNNTKLKIILHTGRSHQIRAHLASIGHPIVGDVKYGSSLKGVQKLTSCGIIFRSSGSFLEYMNNKIITL